ncbi:hypothetical protein D3C71_1465670 [compost metagenome]
MAHILGDILRLHAAAVLDTNDFSRSFVIQILNQAADIGDNFVRVSGSGRFAGTDSPDWLVCDNRLSRLFGSQSLERAFSLHFAYFLRLVGFTLFELLAYAHDWSDAVAERRVHLLVHDFVRFAEISAALGVAENDIIHTQILQHHAADFTGERAAVLEMQVLSADLDGCAFSQFGQNRQIGERRANYGLHACHFSLALNLGKEAFGFRNSLEHFPVASNDWCSTHSKACLPLS